MNGPTYDLEGVCLYTPTNDMQASLWLLVADGK